MVEVAHEAQPEPERDVLHLLAEELQTPESPLGLFLAPETVRNNFSPILTKLNAADRTEAAPRAREAGLRGPAPPR